MTRISSCDSQLSEETHVSGNMKRHHGKINDSKIRSSVNNQVLVDDTTIADGSDLGSTDGVISRRGEDDSATRRQ